MQPESDPVRESLYTPLANVNTFISGSQALVLIRKRAMIDYFGSAFEVDSICFFLRKLLITLPQNLRNKSKFDSILN